jgi:hypothetical protein
MYFKSPNIVIIEKIIYIFNIIYKILSSSIKNDWKIFYSNTPYLHVEYNQQKKRMIH